MKSFLIASFIALSSLLNAQTARTVFNDDYSKWQFDNYSFRTVFNDDWDNWQCNGTSIKTVFTNDWNSWKI